MRDKKDDASASGLPVYTSHPPVWLPKFHGVADLGYPGFHPPRPNQDEDILSEATVRNGFVLDPPVKIETFSAQGMINEQLELPDTLSKLEDLMNEVFIRRAERLPPIPPVSFRIPTRVTLNDAKRHAWFTDLANPDVPLHKLGKNVPHGTKGPDLLDLLHANHVAIPRAVWLLRVLGANETAAQRNKSSYVPSAYSVTWVNVVIGYMKKQLQDILLPSAPRPSLNVKITFKGVLTDMESREKWLSRFTYCLKLLRTFFAEDLVDRKLFLSFLVQHLSSCNLAQAGFMSRLCDEYFEDIAVSRPLSRILAEASLCKLQEISTTSAREFLPDTEYILKTLIQRLALAIPDALVSSKMWLTYSSVLENTMTEGLMKPSIDRSLEQNTRDLRHLLLESYSDVKRRNEALLFRGSLGQVSAKLGTAVSNVKLLNSISSGTDMASISYFAPDINDTLDFKERLDMLLTWSVTPVQYGDHRPFAAVTIIRLWRAKACDRATRRDVATPNEFLQDQLFDWLDASEIARSPHNAREVSLLYGKLVKHEIFCYANYIQRLIARGEPGLTSDEPFSHHRKLLKWIPLFKSTSSLSNQRKVTLYGVRARDTPEDAVEREIRREIRALLPHLFDSVMPTPLSSCDASELPPSAPLPTLSLGDHCQTLMTATRFEQVRTFRQWLLPVFRKRLAKTDSNEPSSLFKCYLTAIELMDYAKCYHSILDLTLDMLQHFAEVDSLNNLIDTFYRYATIWTCMDVMPTIVAALDAAHQTWKHRGIQSRPLLTLLLKFDNGRYLSDTSRERITMDIEAFSLALKPLTDQPVAVPDVLPEILLLSTDFEQNAPSTLVKTLWLKYRASPDWVWKVWDNAVASIRQIPSLTDDPDAQRACALQYGCFLWHLDQHVPNGLDDDVLRWFVGPGMAELVGLNKVTWDVLNIVLLYLAVHGALKSTTILEGIVYPAWELGATKGVGQLEPCQETYLQAANSLCAHLLLHEDGSRTSTPAVDLFEAQCIRTRRQAVFEEPHFPLLVERIPALIALENNEAIPAELRTESTSLRCRLCQDVDFRRAAYRNLDIVRHTFENSPYLVGTDSNSENLSKRAIAGLNMILCDSTDDANLYDWPEVTCLLSPWKIAATTIQLQLQVKQLGRALHQESTAAAATANLNKLTAMLFQHTKTAEEAYYVGEMARGADSVIAAKFINNGITSMTELLNKSTQSTTTATASESHVQQLLRVLIYVSQPFRNSSSSLLLIDSKTHEGFLQALKLRLNIRQASLLEPSPAPSVIGDFVLFCRLLQFILSFRTQLSPTSKALCLEISNLVFRLAMHCAQEDRLNINLYPVLIDTFLALVDEILDDPKSASFDPHKHYPQISPSQIPSDLPQEYHKQLTSFLPFLKHDSIVSNLVHTYTDERGNTVYGSEVLNRPWEWLENLGEPATTDEVKDKQERDRLGLHTSVKNTGPLGLENFAARVSGDAIMHDMDRYDADTQDTLKSFQDGPAESVFVRDWRERRLDYEPESLVNSFVDLMSHNPPLGGLGGAGASGSSSQNTRPSPTGSSASRGSAQTSIQGRFSTSTGHEVIDVDRLPAGPSRAEGLSKRKGAPESDDEIEIVEGPVASNANKRLKAGKGPVGKPKPKKR